MTHQTENNKGSTNCLDLSEGSREATAGEKKVPAEYLRQAINK